MNIKADINDFNTSHVNVNLCDIFFLACQWTYFNTSHVNVNLAKMTC